MTAFFLLNILLKDLMNNTFIQICNTEYTYKANVVNGRFATSCYVPVYLYIC